jgi:hypothetical protein
LTESRTQCWWKDAAVVGEPVDDLDITANGIWKPDLDLFDLEEMDKGDATVLHSKDTNTVRY